ncbi:hypothetical protein G7K_2266-t1 [Saitoella complicata NRRL Y-17804]|uniref:Uncharacterized protein n=1 Tax=Saitoella complicata (strain BCRC 22490 / CBS 7301 / JCM 7358 / NBRC 10748 / NRRL Y-17804) TaxID=698492 RepID=A0A0E9NE06_SAICN|nr:hypothetical protein G7K_2266-t1 [Saitoella complicata NRRL Y-17804]
MKLSSCKICVLIYMFTYPALAYQRFPQLMGRYQLVWPPFRSSNIRTQSGLESISLRISSSVTLCQTSHACSKTSGTLVAIGNISASLRTIIDHKFSIGFISGEHDGQSIRCIHAYPAAPVLCETSILDHCRERPTSPNQECTT